MNVFEEVDQDYLPDWSSLRIRKTSEESSRSVNISIPQSNLTIENDVNNSRSTTASTTYAQSTVNATNVIEEDYHEAAPTKNYIWQRILQTSIKLWEDEGTPNNIHEDLLKEYSIGEIVKGSFTLTNTSEEEVRLYDFLVTLNGTVSVQRKKPDSFGCITSKQTFLYQIDHKASNWFGDRSHTCNQSSLSIDENGTIIGLPDSGILKPKMKFVIPFQFKLPYTLLEEQNELKSHYCQIPPTFGIDKDIIGYKVTDWKSDYPEINIDSTTGYAKVPHPAKPLLVVNDKAPKYCSVSYTISIRIIGYNHFSKTEPVEILKEIKQNIRVISTGYHYDFEEEKAQDSNLLGIIERNRKNVNPSSGSRSGVSSSCNSSSKEANILSDINLNTTEIPSSSLNIQTEEVQKSYKLSKYSDNTIKFNTCIGSLDLKAKVPKRGFQYVPPKCLKKLNKKKKLKSPLPGIPPPDYNSILLDPTDLIPSDFKELKDILITVQYHMHHPRIIPVISHVMTYLNVFTFFNNQRNPILFNTDMVNNGLLSHPNIDDIDELKELDWTVYRIPLCKKSKSRKNLAIGGSSLKNFVSLLSNKSTVNDYEEDNSIILSDWKLDSKHDDIWEKEITMKLDFVELMIKQNICLVPSFHSSLISRIYEVEFELEMEDQIKSDSKISLKIPVRIRKMN